MALVKMGSGMRAGGYVAVAMVWLGVCSPAWGWTLPERRSAPGAGCLSAPLGGGGPAAWTSGRKVVIADLGRPGDRGRRVDVAAACPSLSPDGSLLADAQVFDPLGLNGRVVAWPLPDASPVVLSRSVAGDPVIASSSGETVLAWYEAVRGGTEVRTAVRGPSGFGAVQALGEGGDLDLATTPGPSAGADAAGNVVVAWMRPRDGPIAVARRAPGGTFGTPQVLEDEQADVLSLAVTPDGAALLVWGSPGGVRASMAPPGGRFGAPVDLQHTTIPVGPVAAAASDGSLLAVWSDGRAIRTWDGAGTPRVVARGGDDLHAALAPGGRALLAWIDRDGRLAAATRDGGRWSVARGLSSPCRVAEQVRAGFAPDGRAAVAFTAGGFATEDPPVDVPAVVEVVREGARGPTPAPPRPRVRAAVVRRHVDLLVACPGGCEVLATLARRGRVRDIRRDTHGGTLRLRLDGTAGVNRLPPPGARVTVHVTACSPAGAVARRTISLRR